MPLYWTILFPLAVIASAIHPHGRLTWALDALPALAAFVVLLGTRRWFVWTPLSYALLMILCLVILLGAHYSFGRVPLFEWLKPWLGTPRNDFDKFAHFFQGFAPALAFRELLIRFGVVAGRRWLMLLVPALCLALSAGYELVEWWAALVLDKDAEDFLAMQGDPFDAQSDMAMALLGAVVAVLCFSGRHDRQLARLAAEPGNP